MHYARTAQRRDHENNPHLIGGPAVPAEPPPAPAAPPVPAPRSRGSASLGPSLRRGQGLARWPRIRPVKTRSSHADGGRENTSYLLPMHGLLSLPPAIASRNLIAHASAHRHHRCSGPTGGGRLASSISSHPLARERPRRWLDRKTARSASRCSRSIRPISAAPFVSPSRPPTLPLQRGRYTREGVQRGVILVHKTNPSAPPRHKGPARMRPAPSLSFQASR